MPNRRATGVSGLDEFGLTRRELRGLSSRKVLVEVILHLPPHMYPSRAMAKKLLLLKPEGRRQMVHRWRVDEFRKLRRDLPFGEYQVVRRGRDPIGVRMSLTASAVHELFRLRHAGHINILRIAGLKRRRSRSALDDSLRLYAVKAHFALQWEGQRRGTQLCEERIFVLKARSEKDAMLRAGREFRKETFPCLDSSGYFHRWAFEGIVDVCEPVEREFSAKGTEVYYRFEKRRIKRKHQWHPASAV